MTRLFLRFYLGVLAVLLTAWLIYGSVLRQRTNADIARVVLEAHGGGARLVAKQLQGDSRDRSRRLHAIQRQFAYPVKLLPQAELPTGVGRQLQSGKGVVHMRREDQHFVVSPLPDEDLVVSLGPLPDYELLEIEASVGGWMRLTAEVLQAHETSTWPDRLAELQSDFEFPVVILSRDQLPAWPAGRLAGDADVAFYPRERDQWFAATPLLEGNQVLEFGPFPNFGRAEQKAATTTLALVLLPAAFAIALLLRPVAQQLRILEQAARQIAAGDLSTRVDERRVRSAKSLAQAFNGMAGRTESMVRTQRELLQTVSHELRTPLSRMRFAIDLIESAPDEVQRRQRLESLDAAAEELNDLVSELMSYVRLETTEPHLELEPLSLRDLTSELMPKYAELYPDAHFQIDCDDELAADLIAADPTFVRRAIGNLLSNAGRHAQSLVSVRIRRDDSWIVFTVDDDGPGIPEAERTRVLEPFVRLGDPENGSGTGLGLALVQRIVTQHGGTVSILTSPLGGCRVRTSWPFSFAPDTTRTA